jgi:dienelactone hydrolase
MSCPDCFRGGKATGDPKGTLTTLHGVSTYVAGPAPSSPSASTIIFYTDAFGLGLVNNKLLADAYAAATGFHVLVPDIIPGGPMTPYVFERLDVVMEPVPVWNLWGWLVRGWNLAVALRYAVPFLLRANPSYAKCYAPCLEYARQVRRAMDPGAKLGVAGFCWGGYQSINLCKEATEAGGSERLIDAEFCAHPSRLKLPDDVVNAVLAFKTPVAIAHSTQDMSLKNEEMLKTEAALREKTGEGEGEGGFQWQIKYYEEVPHGFAVRAREGNEKDEAAADEAKAQAIEWFKRWL